MKMSGVFLLVIAALVLRVDEAHARPFRVGQVPNGNKYGCLTCHVSAVGGGFRNAFGLQIETSFLSPPGPSGNVQWGPALAALNADGDGKTNGAELLDSNGIWHAGDPNPGTSINVTNPGLDDVPSVPALSWRWLTMLMMVLGLSCCMVTTRMRQHPMSGRAVRS